MKQDMDRQLEMVQSDVSMTPIRIASECMDKRHGPYGQSMAKILVSVGEQLITDIYAADKLDLQSESFDALPPILEGRNLYKQLAIGKEQTKAWESWDYLLSVMLSPVAFTKMLNRRLFGNSTHSKVRKEILASIIAISWALYNRAIIEQDKVMDRGSFTIHDPEYRLYNYLLHYIHLATRNSSPGFYMGANDFAYDRNPKEYRSSHYINDDKQHGGDIRLWGGGPALPLLPNQATTYLFGSLERDGHPLFWIKFEEWGIGNWMESIYHLFCFLNSGHIQPDNVYREKDIPLPMRQAYTAFKQLLENDQRLPAKTIHAMWQEMIQQYQKNPSHLMSGLLSAFQSTALQHNFNPHQLTFRTGNEVIFDYRDFYQVLHQPLYKTVEMGSEKVLKSIPKDFLEIYFSYQEISHLMLELMKQRTLNLFLKSEFAVKALADEDSGLTQFQKEKSLEDQSYYDLLKIKSSKPQKEPFSRFVHAFNSHVKEQDHEFYSLPFDEKEMSLFLNITHLAEHWLGQLNYLIHNQHQPESTGYRKTRDQLIKTGQRIYQQIMLNVSLLAKERELTPLLTGLLSKCEAFQQNNRFLFYQNEPPLIRAAALGTKQDVKALVRRDPMINLGLRSRRGETAVYIASTVGNSDVVRTLYKYGASIDQAGPRQESAFIAAAYHGNKDVIESMLNVRDGAWFTSGMKRREQDKFGNTAFHYMISSSKWTCIEDRIQAIDRYLQSVIQPTNWFGIKTYNYSHIAKFTSVQNKAGDTPLHLMVETQFPIDFIRDIPKRLGYRNLDIARVFNLNVVNRKNQTPLDIAMQTKNPEMVKFLYHLGGRSTHKALSELDDYLKICWEAPPVVLSNDEEPPLSDDSSTKVTL